MAHALAHHDHAAGLANLVQYDSEDPAFVDRLRREHFRHFFLRSHCRTINERPPPAILDSVLPKKPSISIVGAGNVGSVLAPALRAAGYAVEEIIVRDKPASIRRGKRVARASGAKAVTER